MHLKVRVVRWHTGAHLANVQILFSLSFRYLKTELLDLLRPRTEAGLWGGERGQGALGTHSLLLSVALLPFPRAWNSGVFLFLSY